MVFSVKNHTDSVAKNQKSRFLRHVFYGRNHTEHKISKKSELLHFKSLCQPQYQKRLKRIQQFRFYSYENFI